MYTLDGLWYNVCFFDAIGFMASVIGVASGLVVLLRKKKTSDAKGLLVIGVIACLFFGWMGIRDIYSINESDFRKTEGVFEYYKRESRMAPFTYRYVFSTNKTKKQAYYLDAITRKKHLGTEFEFSVGSKYEIIYDESSKVIVGIKCINERSYVN